MTQRRIPAVFMRGGTSKAVMFHARDLPTERDAWAPIFRSAIGANDPSARQLDGMGGGVSSLSKVCVIGPPSRIEASLVDAANPCVFVDARALDCTGIEMPDAIERNTALMDRLEAIRRAASVAMGIAPDLDAAGRIKSVPKVAMVTAPRAMQTFAGITLGAADMDIVVRMISVGQAHRAVPLTGALCLAVATRLAGTVPATQAKGLRPDAAEIRIANPSGITRVDAKVTGGASPTADYAAVYRTARRLFEGKVLVR